MAKKPSKASRIAPLQELTMVPITDPVKQAALEERLRRGRDEADEASVPMRCGAEASASMTVSQLIDQARRLPVDQKRLLALTLLAEELSADQQLTLVERVRGRSA